MIDIDKKNDRDPSGEDAKAAGEAASDAKRQKDEKEELDEGLEESFPGSDAPASTRRSPKD